MKLNEMKSGKYWVHYISGFPFFQAIRVSIATVN